MSRSPRTHLLLLATCLALGAMACTPTPAVPTGAIRGPIDFAFACEGEGQTQMPSLDERAASLDDARLCPDITLSSGKTVEGHGVGALLSVSPPGLMLLQTNPHSADGRRVLDVETAIPGYTRIPVGKAPIRVLSAVDGSSFYAVSAGERTVTRVVVQSIQGPEGIVFDSTEFPLPGVPSDALILGDDLIVAAAHESELWYFDLDDDPSDPPLRKVVDTEGWVATLHGLGEDLIVTWIDRPVLSRMAADETWTERGLVPACQDGLDNDGDDLIDGADPDCLDPEDDDEFGEAEARVADDLGADLPGFGGVDPCEDGVDNDGDGRTDGDDDACAAGLPLGEWIAACADGIDNDGDGATDEADTGCYGPLDRSEGQLPATGPHRAVVVEAGAAGTFVYALVPGRHEIRVFAVDGAAEGLEPIDVVGGPDMVIPELRHTPYEAGFDGEPTVLAAERHPGLPGPSFGGDTNLRLPSVGGSALVAQRLRGEIWDHIIDAEAGETRAALDFEISGAYRPAGCDPETTDRCVQPAGDDDTYYVYMSRMDGRLQMIEVVRRGVAVHRFAQTHSEVDLRGTAADRPTLKLRGRSVGLGNNLAPGHAFLGPLLQEPYEDQVEGASPATYRRYGIWPPADPELVATQLWTLSYEGVIPDAQGYLGSLGSDDRLEAPHARFCEAGVQIGDWLTVIAPVEAVDPALRPPTPEVSVGDSPCATQPPVLARIDVAIAEVGDTWIRLDLDSAQLRPEEPVLDEAAIRDAKVASLSACHAALKDLRLVLTNQPTSLVPTEDVSIATLPPRFRWEVRAANTWTAVGSRSSFLHTQRWNGESQECEEDPTMDTRHVGRVATVDLADDAYDQCPPSLEQIGIENVEAFAGEGAPRLSNFSFDLQAFPGCLTGDDGGIQTVGPQRDTVWSFNFYGPSAPKTVSAQSSLLGVRIGKIDVRRHLVQLDTAGGKVHILQVRPGVEKLLKTFE